MTTTPTPKHNYETTEGTEPTTYGEHQPRTMRHTVTTGAETELHMMTEIGDGVFVQWSTCERCHKQVAGCSCHEGPQEPKYMKAWRDRRFAKELNTRPEPDVSLNDSVIQWVKDRGYTVTKKREPKPGEARSIEDVDLPVAPPARPSTVGEAESEPVVAATEDVEPRAETPEDAVEPEAVDAGLDEALERVRAAKARDISSLPDEF